MQDNGDIDLARLSQCAHDRSIDAIFWFRGLDIVCVNEAACRSLGYTREELESMTLDEIDTFQPASSKAKLMDQLAEVGAITFETRHTRKDGTSFPVDVSLTLLETTGDHLVCGVARDCSERKTNERLLLNAQRHLESTIAELRRNQARLETIQRATFDAIAVSEDGVIREINDRFAEMMNTAPDAAVGACCVDFLKDGEVPPSVDPKLGEPAQPIELIGKRADGSLFDIELVKREIIEDGTALIVTAVRDISARKLSEQELRTALNAGQMGTWRWSVVKRRLHLSDESLAMLGLSPGGNEIGIGEWESCCHPEDLAAFQDAVKQAIRNKRELRCEYRACHGDGAQRWIEVRGDVTELDADGNVIELAGVTLDNTEQQLAQEELRLRRFVVDNCAEALFTHDLEGNIVDVNTVACDRLGYTRHEMLSKRIQDFDVGVLRRESVTSLVASGVTDVATQHQHKDGGVLDIVISAQLFEYRGRELVCTTAKDVTELNRSNTRRHELDQDLTHINRRASLGEMATAIAHELNQPLSVVSNNAEIVRHLAAQQNPDLEMIRESAKLITSQSIRAGEIVRRMRGFLSRQVAREATSVSSIIEETILLIEPQLRHSLVTVNVNCEDLPNVNVDRIQIQQVFVNLMKNAIESMSETPKSERLIDVVGSAVSGNMLRVVVTDRGPGIPEEHRERLFNQFITTKVDGMGMGLAISRSIVMNHGGQLTFVASGAKGATFAVELPTMEPCHEEGDRC